MNSDQSPPPLHDDSFSYEETAKRLLYLGSVAEIKAFLEQTPGLDIPKILQTLDVLDGRLIESERKREHLLLDFVRKVVVEHSKKADLEPSQITTADDLVQAALGTSTALAAYKLMRRHKHLLTSEAYAKLEFLIASDQRSREGQPRAEELSRIRVLCAMSLLIDSNEIAVKAQLFWASYCRGIGNLRNALRRLGRAEKLAEGSDDILLQIGPLGMRASLFDSMNDVPKAADAYLKTLNIIARAKEDFLAHPVQLKLGGCYRAMGRYSDALMLMDAVLVACEKYDLANNGSWTTEARCRNLRGLLLEDLERYDEGGVEYEKAAKLSERFGDRGRQFTALTNVAASYGKRGEPRAAVDKFRQLLQTVEEWANPIMISSCHNNIGQMLLMSGRALEAREEFGKALAVKLSSGLPKGEFITLLGMGDASFELGDKEAAQTFYTMALIPLFESGDLDNVVLYASRIHSGNIEPDDGKMAESGLRMAQASGHLAYELMLVSYLFDQKLAKGDHESAVKLIRETIQRAIEKDPQSPDLMRLQIKLAGYLSDDPKTCNEAYGMLTTAISRVEQQMNEMIIDQRRAEIVSNWADLYGTLINLLVARRDSLFLPPNVDAFEMAFNLHEAAKCRSFVAGLADTFIRVPTAVPVELQQQETRLLELEREFQPSASRDRVIAEEYRLKRLREINDQLQVCWKQMEPYNPEYVRLRLGTPVTLNDCVLLLSHRARAVTALVSFYCDKNRTTCFVLRSDTKQLQVFQCATNREQLLEAAKQLRRAFNGAPTEFPPFPPIRRDRPWDRNIESFDAMSSELLKFLSALEDVELVCVAPHGPLHLLPLHALRSPDGEFLINRFAVTYCPSMTTLKYCIERGDRFQSGPPRSVYCAGVASRDDAHQDYFEQDELIFAGKEWQNVELDRALTASKARVLEKLADSELVHLTCHGYFDDNDPLNSGLLVSDGRERPPRNARTVPLRKRQDFLITARNLLRTRMRSRLVALRACSTGLQAERNSGDEFEGLSRALLYAGNASLLVSLWNVDQQSSQKLLNKFYDYWRASDTGGEKWRALWMAQKDFISNAEEPFLGHPYHWAPLNLIGDWS